MPPGEVRGLRGGQGRESSPSCNDMSCRFAPGDAPKNRSSGFYCCFTFQPRLKSSSWKENKGSWGVYSWSWIVVIIGSARKREFPKRSRAILLSMRLILLKYVRPYKQSALVLCADEVGMSTHHYLHPACIKARRRCVQASERSAYS